MNKKQPRHSPHSFLEIFFLNSSKLFFLIFLPLQFLSPPRLFLYFFVQRYLFFSCLINEKYDTVCSFCSYEYNDSCMHVCNNSKCHKYALKKGKIKK